MTYLRSLSLFIRRGPNSNTANILPLEHYLISNKRTESPEKLSTILTSIDKQDTVTYQLLTLNNITIPLNKNFRFLGITFNIHMTLSKFTQNTRKTANTKPNTLTMPNIPSETKKIHSLLYAKNILYQSLCSHCQVPSYNKIEPNRI